MEQTWHAGTLARFCGGGAGPRFLAPRLRRTPRRGAAAGTKPLASTPNSTTAGAADSSGAVNAGAPEQSSAAQASTTVQTGEELSGDAELREPAREAAEDALSGRAASQTGNPGAAMGEPSSDTQSSSAACSGETVGDGAAPGEPGNSRLDSEDGKELVEEGFGDDEEGASDELKKALVLVQSNIRRWLAARHCRMLLQVCSALHAGLRHHESN